MDSRSSVAAFLFHPNLRGLGSCQRQRVPGGTLEGNAAVSTIVNWMPRQRVPGGELSDVQSGSVALRNIVSWMRRRGLAPHDGETFFFDITDGTAYTVDMACEMEGKLTLVLIYASGRALEPGPVVGAGHAPRVPQDTQPPATRDCPQRVRGRLPRELVDARDGTQT